MMPFTPFTAKTLVFGADDVDTDQIIPARFLKGTAKTGLGVHLFADLPHFARPAGTGILVAGRNFGCGSSREHAPWALVDAGFRAVIASSFADIFRQNAIKNQLLPIELPDTRIDSNVELHVDLDAVTLPDGTRLPFTLDPFAKHCLASGLDELGYLLSFADRITEHERRRG